MFITVLCSLICFSVSLHAGDRQLVSQMPFSLFAKTPEMVLPHTFIGSSNAIKKDCEGLTTEHQLCSDIDVMYESVRKALGWKHSLYNGAMLSSEDEECVSMLPQLIKNYIVSGNFYHGFLQTQFICNNRFDERARGYFFRKKQKYVSDRDTLLEWWRSLLKLERDSKKPCNVKLKQLGHKKEQLRHKKF